MRDAFDTSEAKPALFTPFDLGRLSLRHRVVHAPTTRLRADPDLSPSGMMKVYYEQRASPGGLLIAESTHPSFDSRGYEGAPGLYTQAHVRAWRDVTDAVHARRGLILVQLGHDGRQSHADLSDGRPPIAPSVVPFDGQALTSNGWVPVSPHRAVEAAEIPFLVQSFRRAAERALDAGFDGVEFHNANGYLADTFLQDGTNHRTDRYGGPVQNRVRFSLEVLESLLAVWGPGRVGIRISPSGTWGGISDSDPETTFGYFAERLNDYPLAYLHVIEPRVAGVETIQEGQPPVAARFLRRIYKSAIIAAGGFTRESAEAIIAADDADLVAFGRFFTSNPDLPLRFETGAPLTPYVRDAFWGGDERAYIDFPRHAPGGSGRSDVARGDVLVTASATHGSS